jgi:hypothetical protein
MTDRTGAFRRYIVIAAATLAVAAAILVLGVAPPIRSDSFPGAAPETAAAAFQAHAVIVALLVIVLAIAERRAVEQPRQAIAVFMLIGSVALLLGMLLVDAATAFWGHGPALHGAVTLILVSATAEFASIGALAAAAARLRESKAEPHGSQDMGAWKVRIAPAALLGVGLFFLLIFVGEAGEHATISPAMEFFRACLLVVVLGGYSLAVTYVLSRGLPRAARNLWLVLALVAPLLLTGFIALLVESNKVEALQTLGLAIVSGACSWGGLALAARPTGPQLPPTK